MMCSGYYDWYGVAARMRDIMAPPERPSLVTGSGHGHCRKLNRERPKKDFKAKRRKREKMAKTSKRRNRGAGS